MWSSSGVATNIAEAPAEVAAMPRPRPRNNNQRQNPRPARRPVFAIPVDWVPLQRVSPATRIADAAYRLTEIIAAAVALVLLLPVMLIEAALIRFDSPGPALFFQRSVLAMVNVVMAGPPGVYFISGSLPRYPISRTFCMGLVSFSWD